MRDVQPRTSKTASAKLRWAGIVMILAGALIAFLLERTWLLDGDEDTWENFVNSRSAGATEFWSTITIAFNPSVATIVSIVLGLAIWLLMKSWRNGLFLVVSMVVSTIITHALKAFVGRERPPEIDRLIVETNFSFPSGHATAVSAMCVSLALLASSRIVSRSRRHFWLKLIIWLGAAVVIVVIAISRLYLGVHWVSDVTAGVLIGSGTAFAFAWMITVPKAAPAQPATPGVTPTR
ncbi:MAG TPA: phosphatase PAP2 family protein [Candidatus Corynebacterium gallistercoris]|uniref:Phosphatase PAP2 family protein n=1 Tax=Candidatus Corynebacterium gallistercoris TaxID=2838530 RepID=A0A9D1RXC1_9CORY|nr:phosphatase PAP2 family protein [Candidatus Corynebacterium gallistercoris]